MKYKRSELPIEVAIYETVRQIHYMVLAERRFKVCEISESIVISHGSVVSILNDYFGMRKLSTTFGHQRNRATTSNDCLALFNHNPVEFQSTPFHIRGRIMNSPKSTGNMVTVGFPRRISIEVDRDKSVLRWVCQSTVSRRQIFKMHTVKYTSVTCKRVEYNVKRNDRIWPRRKSSPTKAMQRFQHALSPRQNIINWVRNCPLIWHTHRI